MRSWSASRLAGAAVLGIWAALFWYLMITEQTFLYLSPRTDWVVPVGGVLCTVGAVGTAAAARVARPDPLRPRHAAALGFVAFPVVVVLALPPATLGAYAADRRSSFVSSGFATDPDSLATGELTLLDVAGALRSAEAMDVLATRAGTEVTFVGFVTRNRSMAADEFVLTRFLLSCCVADALSVQVRVVGAATGDLEEDEWVSVTGPLYPVGKEVVVQAEDITRVERPKRPYLSP